MPQKTKQTPMMEQYFSIKDQYPDAFLFYRLGDFYELFHDDAIKAAKLLEITLTSRNKNADDPIPMCGVPYHSAKEYIRTLISMGYKVAICEQMEDPKATKGMVKRDVVQVLTPGTYMADSGNESKSNNYLVAVQQQGTQFPFSYVDIGTGELRVTVLDNVDAVITEIQSLSSKEMIVYKVESDIASYIQKRTGVLLSEHDPQKTEEDFTHLKTTIVDEESKAVLDLLVSYLSVTQKRSLSHIQPAVRYEPDQYLKMDTYARRNLELTASIRNQQKAGSLLWLLDRTKTAMGGRKLKQWLEKPLINEAAIKARQDKVSSLLNHYFERMDLNDSLSSVYDLERLVAKVSFGNVNGRDMIQLKTSLSQIPLLKQAIEATEDGIWNRMLRDMNEVPELIELIERSIVEDPPLQITEGNIIKDGYHEKLDEYRDAMRHGKQWIAALQQAERENTGIKTLKIGYNRVFGYYIEVSKANAALLPEGRYDRKQTLANAERFITPELKEKERIILEAEEKSATLEYDLFIQVRDQIKAYSEELQRLARVIAEVDVLQSFAQISEEKHYVRPTVSADSRSIHIEEGRHPVVEEVLGKDQFIANHIEMEEDNDILLITGPNMSGKSTYMRQLALIAIMAQMGCFIPAERASLPIFDQIFTRIGAADDLFSGQSTFMVEMVETNQALQFATERSLILFDEIGRGTATYDGMALAEAILRHLHQANKGKTLFSTHYHELTVLEEELSGLSNVHVGAIEQDGELVFLHKIMKGPADKSYGLHVAKLAGMPDSLIQQAKEILHRLETGAKKEVIHQVAEDTEQISLFGDEDFDLNGKQVLNEVKEIPLENRTPMDIFTQVHAWKQMLNKKK
ncbi:DNA mismatch repair protein MutS [Jeotgalibaca caeni]|uniref:DNA mismatch repair protein MutS n=1 Tax=Jeotgalibaca caeni TaxID=3028623 RepID=UPI00237D7041|nr:DNA mismatch repair protein MutS [Jeotgalibaca caeni]MDE1548964.1 DNA mismatch repair protein MutS [Jeotgalibaca caeni]